MSVKERCGAGCSRKCRELHTSTDLVVVWPSTDVKTSALSAATSFAPVLVGRVREATRVNP